MRAGLLHERIDIEVQSGSRDSYGDVSESWSTYAANVPATVNPIRGKEQLTNNTTMSETTHRIYIRYSSDVSGITTNHRIKLRNESPVRYLDIKSIANVDMRDKHYEIMCAEWK